MESTITGKVIKFGDNINTDLIIQARHLRSIDPAELARHVFEMMGEEYPEKLRRFDILVAGENFGCGSAREQAASSLVGAGIKAIVAASFARVFFRNAINSGLPIVECPPAVSEIEEGETLTLDFEQGRVVTPRGEHRVPPLPSSVREILDVGGLVPYLRRQFQSQASGK